MKKESSISVISGIGTVRARAFARLGIENLFELVYHFPRAYENRADIRTLADADTAQKHSYILTVATEPKNYTVHSNLRLTKFRAFDDSGTAEVVFYNQPYIADGFAVGKTYRFYGRAGIDKRGITLSSPAHEEVCEDLPLPDLIPLYTLSAGITRQFMQKSIAEALRLCLSDIDDALPPSVRRENNLPMLSYAIENIHRPQDRDALSRAAARLAFDEIFEFFLLVSLSRARRTRARAYRCVNTDISKFLACIKFELTGAQIRSIDEIRADMSAGDSDAPEMSRLLSGDVGSGKTVVAAAAVYIALTNNLQAALLAPTEILAAQHFADLKEIFESLGFCVAYLSGGVSASEKKKIYDGISSGKINLVIGTHALLSDKVIFKKLGLIVTDEQHRFGVRQRAQLSEKNANAHMLVMSATPIPRTLSLVMYGDLDISKLDEMPKGRQRVDTFAVDESYRERLNGFILKQISLGGQVYIVCPAIESADEDEYNIGEVNAFGITDEQPARKNAVDFAKQMKKTFPHIAVGFVHGRMKAEEKNSVMREFAAGKIKILVSTTVIEVGVNVPSATLMIVENAEFFGLSQLHQLRGRVGRGNKKSYCVLVSGSKSESARERLDIMRTTYDGFEIAERDLVMRGPGDFLGESGEAFRQHGAYEFKMARLCTDRNILEQAKSAAEKLVSENPTLEGDEFLPLVKKLSEKIELGSSTIN